MKAGSLFSGVGGLDLALEHFGYEVAWQSEIDPHCSTVLARHWPGAPNLGDVTKIDWEQVPHVDLIAGGFPCQDLSYAGKGAGLTGERSGLYWHIWHAARHLRPRYVVLENVSALLVRGGPTVVASLAALGYGCRWGVVRASDAGAPHQRARVFIVASDTDVMVREARRPLKGRPGEVDEPGTQQRAVGSGGVHLPPDPDRVGSQGDAGQPAYDGDTRDNTDRLGRDGGWRRPGSTPAWGQYAPAINRWETITGELAPNPLDGRRLNPELSRWMMGLPAGWLDGMTRTQALKAAGNAVCWQQAVLALTLLDLKDPA